jgi:hypothetical protein
MTARSRPGKKRPSKSASRETKSPKRSESGGGSTKGKAHKHDDKMEVHADVPDPIPADAKLWIEVETDAGKTKGSLTYK